MRVKDLVKLSTRMFKARASRTFLTILGIGIGMAAILFFVSLGYGLQKLLLDRITTSDALLALSVLSNSSEDYFIGKEVAQEMETIPGVVEVSPAYQANARVRFENFTTDSEAMVTNPSFQKLEGTKIVEGVGLNDSERYGVVVSTAFAKAFNKTPEETLGKEISLILFMPERDNRENKKEVDIDQKYKIIGFVEKDDVFILINTAGLAGKVEIPFYSELRVKCRTSEDITPVREKITGMGFSVSSLSDTIHEANKVFTVVKGFLAFFGLIALFVSAIGMFNTMTVALLERTEEIGIMKSIGASDFDILMMFVVESTVMGVLGGISGVAIGLLGEEIFNYGINFLAKTMGGEQMDLFYNPVWFIGFIILFSVFVGFATGIIPAKRASSVDPLDALRYK